MEADIVTCDEDLQKVRDAIIEYKLNTTAIKEEIDAIDTEMIETREGLDTETRTLNAHNEEFNELCTIHERKSKELVELDLRIQKIAHENERFQKERQNSQQTVQELEIQYDWIVDEKQYVWYTYSFMVVVTHYSNRYFGEPGTVYDFQNMNVADIKKQLQQALAKHELLRKKINVRVMNMIDK